MTEAQIELAICNALSRRGHFCIKNKDQAAFRDGSYRKGSSYQVRGISDLTVFLNDGVCVWLEVKKPEGVQSDAQKAFQKRITSMGHIYVVVRSVEQAKQAVEKALQS